MQPQIKAIVYTSGTGFTARYANLLAESTHLPAYRLEESSSLPAGTPVFYMGWLMAGQIKGIKKAAKRFTLVGICGVGMARENSPETLRNSNHLGSIPVFFLRGGYDPHKLKGMNKLIMSMATKAMLKAEHTSGDDMQHVLSQGVDFVRAEQLTEISNWMQQG